MQSNTQFSHRNRRRAILSLLPLFLLVIGIAAASLNIDKIRTLFIGAAGEEANIQIDTQDIIGPMPRPWRNLAQGGEDAKWRIQPIDAQVRALHPEYIRIDHLYDFYVVVSRNGGQLTYDWTAADAIVSDILATGAKPYLVLSYMPAALTTNGDITSEPSNWGEYQNVVERTIAHFSKERGIDDVMYEVWNEPDLFGGWRIGGSKDYLSLYSAAAHGAAQAQAAGAKAFKIGGPATTGLYPNWMNTLLSYAEKNNLRLDFISWHDYNSNVDQYKKDVAQVQDIISQHPKFSNIEFQMTEWGFDPKNNPGYDTNFGAAHTVAVATELIGVIQRAFVFEIQDGKSPTGSAYWGRWGLITHNDAGARTKPRYNALQMLDRLGPERLTLLGRGSWVKGAAATDGSTITAILANYDPAGLHGETVPVTFNNLAQRNYQLEVDYLDGIKRIMNIATSEASLETDVPMLANSVAFLKLEPVSTTGPENPTPTNASVSLPAQ